MPEKQWFAVGGQWPAPCCGPFPPSFWKLWASNGAKVSESKNSSRRSKEPIFNSPRSTAPDGEMSGSN